MKIFKHCEWKIISNIHVDKWWLLNNEDHFSTTFLYSLCGNEANMNKTLQYELFMI
jgi:hypothetical protein